jgi:hypothetical protein
VLILSNFKDKTDHKQTTKPSGITTNNYARIMVHEKDFRDHGSGFVVV